MQSILGLPPEVAVFVGVLVLILATSPLILKLINPQKNLVKRAGKLDTRIHSATQQAKTSEDTKVQSLRKASGDITLPLITSLLTKLDSVRLLRDRLARAGLTITAERYIAYNILVFALVTLLCLTAFEKPMLLSVLLGIIAGLGLPHFITGMMVNKRVKKFLILFPDAVDLIVRGLRAGLPVTESIKMVAKEIEEPVGTVFGSIVDKMALGVPLEKTLYETSAKFRITEFDFFVTSIVLQRETGGNLSEILANLSEALRQRIMMRLKIKAMSSEAKASMYIIGALPFVVLLALKITSPEYLAPLFDDYRGNIAAAIAGAMLSTGVFVMVRMTKFEI